MAEMIIECHRCEFPFNPMDRRSWVSSINPDGALCPLCATTVLRSMEAWCVWNDCQGIWEDTVHARRVGAAEHLNTTHADIGGRVVPVRIFKEHEDDIGMREWREAHDFEGKE